MIIVHRGLQWRVYYQDEFYTYLENIEARSHVAIVHHSSYEHIQDTNLTEQEEKEAKNDENTLL